jgi:Protein of unknwon function (DUF3310)
MTGQLLDVFDGNGDKMVDEGGPVHPSFRDQLADMRSRFPAKTTPEPGPEDPTDWVNHPPHYTQGNIEVIDFIRDQKLGYCEGNSVKYICRAPHKGDELEDLKKARFYLEVRIEELEQIRRSGETT